ncbi:MAG: prefoldin subunit alpha [Candidatus Thorarchaeota archaeon]|nr:MAG: prefoldin subunit alpha [Candidatus Thorarchaeota archaeon]
MSNEQQQLLQRIYTEQQITESDISLLQQRIEIIQAYLANYQSGLMVLQEIEKKKKGEAMLMNVGGNIYVEAKLVNPSKVTRGIGSGVRLEQSLEEAKKAVQISVEGLERQYQSMTEEYQKLVSRASVLNTQFQQLAAKVQESTSQK